MSDVGDFKQKMWEARIPRQSRVLDPFHKRFEPWAHATGKLDRERPVWLQLSSPSFNEAPEEHKLFGLAAKAGLIHGTEVICVSAAMVGEKASGSLWDFTEDYFEAMLFVQQPEWLNESQLFGFINVYRYWRARGWPLWLESCKPIKEYYQSIPEEVSDDLQYSPDTLDWYVNDLRTWAQVLKASDYV